jgi:polar amino acid transport system substrate-binding protein
MCIPNCQKRARQALISLAMRLFVLAASLALLAPACVPSEEEPAVEPGTTMAGIARKGTLVVGVDSNGGRLQGFTRGLAELIAEPIGVEIQFVTASSDDLLAMIAAEEVDVAFPAVPITEERLRAYRIADPYYVGHQRLLVPAASPVDDLSELASSEVCAYLDPTTGVYPTGHVHRVVSAPADCVLLLKSGERNAATAIDALLAEMVGELGDAEWRMAGDDLTTEGFGAIVQEETIRFIEFIDAVFEQVKEDGRWMDLYDEWLGPYVDDPVDRPPIMTVQEAAALYPIGT